MLKRHFSAESPRPAGSLPRLDRPTGLPCRRTAIQAAAGVGLTWAGLGRPIRAQEEEIPPPEAISLETKDRVMLRCTYYPGTQGKDSVPIIMLHDFQGRRTEYDALARGLQRVRGHAVIVPDLRGHGESTRRRGLDGDDQTIEAADLRPADFAAMVELDLEKIKGFLLRKNNASELNIEKLCVIAAGSMGSVVGVNWVLKDWSQPILPTLKQGQDVKALVLLSPATNYKSLKATPAFNHPYVGGKLSTLLIGGSKESDIKTIYNQLKRKHAPTPTDEEERLKHQDLFYFLEETELKGTRLLRAGLGVDQKILQFIDLRIVRKAEDFPWTDRTSPLEK